MDAKRVAPRREMTREELRLVYRAAQAEAREALVRGYVREHLVPSAEFNAQLTAHGLDPASFWPLHFDEIVGQIWGQLERGLL